MLIGIDASRANRPHKSGTEWYAFYLIKQLAEIDKDNQYILYADKPLTNGLSDLTSEQFDINEPIRYDKDGYQLIKSYHGNFKAKVLSWPFKFFWTLGRFSLEMLCCRPDALFIPAHTLPLIHPSRSIVTIHDIGFKRQAKLYHKDRIGYRSRAVNLLIKIITLSNRQSTQFDYLDWSTKFALKRAKKIIAISEFTKQELLDVYGAPKNKITVVHNGYNDRLYRPLPIEDFSATLARNGLARPYIFYVGRLEKKKNTANLIEAFALLKQQHPTIKHKLVLVGNASYGFDEIKYNISEYNLDNEVIMTGWIKETSMPHIYNGADGFIFPSNYEGFGIPLLQAMACGTPIVASDIAPIREVIGEAGLLFNPDRTSDMADKMFALLSNENLKQALIAKGLARVKDFSWQKCARETLAVITRK